MAKLGIFDKFRFTIEPYWKYEDMVVSIVEIDSNNIPKDEQLNLIAEKWEKYSKSIITSETINENIIKIPDVAMINIWVDALD